MTPSNRLYTMALAILLFLTTLSAGLLIYLAGVSAAGAVNTLLPDGALIWVALINVAYAVAIMVTLCARVLNPDKGRSMSRMLNWALLPALPGGTIVGLYGLLRVDRKDA